MANQIRGHGIAYADTVRPIAKGALRAAYDYYTSPAGIATSAATALGYGEKGAKAYNRASKAYSTGRKIYGDYSNMSSYKAPFVKYGKTPRRRPKSKIKRLQNDVRELKRYDKTGMGTHVHRTLDSNRLVCGDNAQNAIVLDVNSVTNMEGVLANLKYFNPSLPGTLTTADLSTGTYARNINFESISASLNIRNNYRSTCEVDVYLCVAKDDTSLPVTTAWTNGLPDNGNLTAVTDLGQYPTDYNQVNDLWKLKLLKRKKLEAGEECDVSHSERNIEIDPSVINDHSLAYQNEYKSYQILVIVRGGIAHDSIQTSEQTTTAAGVDLLSKFTYKVRYNAGVNLHRIHVVNNMDTAFTNSGLQSQKPVTGNQAFKQAT